MHLRKTPLLALLCLLFISCNDTDEVFVRYVIDGDTFITSDGEKVRMYGIDAPELQQPFGNESKRFLQRWALHKKLYLERFGKDKYHRTIANVRFVPNASTLNKMLVLNGYAWADKLSHNYELEEDMTYAKENKQGLWAYENVAPYIFRKTYKK